MTREWQGRRNFCSEWEARRVRNWGGEKAPNNSERRRRVTWGLWSFHSIIGHGGQCGCGHNLSTPPLLSSSLFLVTVFYAHTVSSLFYLLGKQNRNQILGYLKLSGDIPCTHRLTGQPAWTCGWLIISETVKIKSKVYSCPLECLHSRAPFDRWRRCGHPKGSSSRTYWAFLGFQVWTVVTPPSTLWFQPQSFITFHLLQ